MIGALHIDFKRKDLHVRVHQFENRIEVASVEGVSGSALQRHVVLQHRPPVSRSVYAPPMASAELSRRVYFSIPTSSCARRTKRSRFLPYRKLLSCK